MRRIFHVITTLERGGAENQLVQVVAAQKNLGYDVEVVYLKGENQLKDEIETTGGHVDGSLANKRPLIQLFLLKKKLRGAPVVHAHLPRAELLCAFLRLPNLVVTRHNAEQFFPQANKWISKLLSLYVVSRSKAVIAISFAVKDFLCHSGEVSLKTKINVVHYGYFSSPDSNFESSSPKNNHIEPAESLVVGTISRLTEQKDIPTLLNSFKVFLQRFPNSQLRIIGDGHLRKEMEQLADQLQITANVEWLGRLMDIRSQIETWDIFVLTSRYEGFGLVLLEAADANVPIVASNISAIPEVLGASYRLLATPGDYLDFANKMISATEVATINYCESHNAKLIGRFDPYKMATRLIEIYGKNE